VVCTLAYYNVINYIPFSVAGEAAMLVEEAFMPMDELLKKYGRQDEAIVLDDYITEVQLSSNGIHIIANTRNELTPAANGSRERCEQLRGGDRIVGFDTSLRNGNVPCVNDSDIERTVVDERTREVTSTVVDYSICRVASDSQCTSEGSAVAAGSVVESVALSSQMSSQATESSSTMSMSCETAPGGVSQCSTDTVSMSSQPSRGESCAVSSSGRVEQSFRVSSSNLAEQSSSQSTQDELLG